LTSRDYVFGVQTALHSMPAYQQAQVAARGS
jgi:hypothetical protein